MYKHFVVCALMATAFADCIGDFYSLCFSGLSSQAYSDVLTCSESEVIDYCNSTIGGLQRDARTDYDKVEELVAIGDFWNPLFSSIGVDPFEIVESQDLLSSWADQDGEVLTTYSHCNSDLKYMCVVDMVQAQGERLLNYETDQCGTDSIESICS